MYPTDEPTNTREGSYTCNNSEYLFILRLLRTRPSTQNWVNASQKYLRSTQKTGRDEGGEAEVETKGGRQKFGFANDD